MGVNSLLNLIFFTLLKGIKKMSQQSNTCETSNVNDPPMNQKKCSVNPEIPPTPDKDKQRHSRLIPSIRQSRQKSNHTEVTSTTSL